MGPGMNVMPVPKKNKFDSDPTCEYHNDPLGTGDKLGGSDPTLPMVDIVTYMGGLEIYPF